MGEGSGSTALINWADYVTDATFQPLVDGILSLFPIVISVCVPLILLRKGWGFLRGNMYSA